MSVRSTADGNTLFPPDLLPLGLADDDVTRLEVRLLKLPKDETDAGGRRFARLRTDPARHIDPPARPRCAQPTIGANHPEPITYPHRARLDMPRDRSPAPRQREYVLDQEPERLIGRCFVGHDTIMNGICPARRV